MYCFHLAETIDPLFFLRPFIELVWEKVFIWLGIGDVQDLVRVDHFEAGRLTLAGKARGRWKYLV